MALLLYDESRTGPAWEREFRTAFPDMEIRTSRDVGSVSDISYAAVWAPPPDLLASCLNLRLILSLGAGIDHIAPDPRIRHIPIVKLQDPMSRRSMISFALSRTTMLVDGGFDCLRQQRHAQWVRPQAYSPETIKVAVLGLGWLGRACATALADAGYNVAGWSRSQKDIEGVACGWGHDGLQDAIDDANLIVCLLPLTRETADLLDMSFFKRCRAGVSLMNLGRGGIVVDADLLAAIDDGLVSWAVLDVFRQEPLPGDHPFWRQDRIIVSPHIAGIASPSSGIKALEKAIRKHMGGIDAGPYANRELEY